MSTIPAVAGGTAVTHSQSFLSRGQLAFAFGLAALLAAPTLMAQAVGTAFTHQGELRDAGSPASASCDFEFRLFDATESGGQIGQTLSLPAVEVTDGLFSVELDFGAGQFVGDAQWLEVAVRPAAGNDFEVLMPRTQVTAAPCALAALTALDGSVSSASISSGAAGTNQINSSQVQRRVSGSCPEGQYLRIVAQNGTVTCASDTTGNDWSRGGNAGTDAETDFLGTADAQPLEIRTANVRSLRIEPSSILFSGLPINATVVAGSWVNSVDGEVRGASIGGGGAPSGNSDPDHSNEGPNRVTDNYGTVGGGLNNIAGDDSGTGSDRPYATVAEGTRNVASGDCSVVAGGGHNTASGSTSAVLGGGGNSATGYLSAVLGGYQNSASGDLGLVGAGESNRASVYGSMVLGGALNRADAQYSFETGGTGNHASASYASVGGGQGNSAGGDYSRAGGRNAKIRPPTTVGAAGTCASVGTSGDADGDNGTVIWADSQEVDFVSSGPNQFLVRAAGGVASNDSTVPNQIDLLVNSRSNDVNADLMLRSKTSDTGINFGATSGGTLFVAKATIAGNSPAFTNYAQWNDSGVFRLFVDNPIKPTAGGFAAPSDARLKQHIAPLDGALDRLLALRGVRFAYRPETPNGLYAPGEHTGFIAQEVEAVFPDWVSEHDSGYKMVAPKGFDALAVEALRELRGEQQAEDARMTEELRRLRRDNAALQARLTRIEEVLRAAMEFRR